MLPVFPYVAKRSLCCLSVPMLPVFTMVLVFPYVMLPVFPYVACPSLCCQAFPMLPVFPYVASLYYAVMFKAVEARNPLLIDGSVNRLAG